MEEMKTALLPQETLQKWNEISALIEEKYDMEITCGKGFGSWKLEKKYRRGGKTLCALYARENYAELLVTLGKAEREKLEAARADYSPALMALYDATQTYHDGKWLWVPLDDTLRPEDAARLLAVKRRPNRKPDAQQALNR